MTGAQEAQRQTILAGAYHDYKKMLNSYAFFKVSDREVAEDLVQETFIKTWKYLVKGGRVDVMKAFLYHVLNHLIVDEYRKHKTVSLDTLLDKGYEPPAVSNPERTFNILDGKASVLLIEKLPEKYRKVLRMRYARDMSLAEISLVTKQSKNTIAVQVHRGLEKLKLLHESA